MNKLLAAQVLSFLSVQGELFETRFKDAMMEVLPDFNATLTITPVFTVGETLPSSEFEDFAYTPPGVLDGTGAWKINSETVRVYSNHELNSDVGYPYTLCADLACNNTYTATGARISYFDFDIQSLKLKESGIAYKFVYDGEGNLVPDASWAALDEFGFARFCSAQFVDANEYGLGLGIEDAIQFGPEENSQSFGAFGGNYWALDILSESFWKVPALGHGSWESITQIFTGSADYVAFVMPDDTSPIDVDADGELEAAPLYLYVGEKDRSEDADFLAKNGLRGGKMYVWVPDDQTLNSPETFQGTGNTQEGTWVEIDYTPQPNLAGTRDPNTDIFLFDEQGFPTQVSQWLRAKAVGAFKFSRPEDISSYSRTNNEFVVTSTGITAFDGEDSFGTIYTMEVNFDSQGVPLKANLTILIDADALVDRSLRSPDNLDWADDGFVYVQEDRAISETPDGEQLFGDSATNRNEAQLIRINGSNPDGVVTKLAQINRSTVLDPTLENPTDAVDVSAGTVGTWESTGILEVSALFGRKPGTLFIGNIQAHGIVGQTDFNPESRIKNDDLVEGGQMVMIEFSSIEFSEPPFSGALATQASFILFMLTTLLNILFV